MKSQKRSNIIATAAAMILLFSMTAFAQLPDLPGSYYTPGDVNGDDLVIGSDVTFLVNYFRGISTLPDSVPFEGGWLRASGDVNGDCIVIGSDVTYLVNYFRGISQMQFCAEAPPRCVVEVWDADINAGDNVNWTSG